MPLHPSSVAETQSTVTASADAVVSGPLTRKSVPYSYRNGCPVGPSQLRRISVNYWAYDGTGQDSVATVTATTTPVPPTVGPDSATTPPGAQVRIPVLGNDSDAYDERLTVTSLANPPHGTAVIDGSEVLYTPDAG